MLQSRYVTGVAPRHKLPAGVALRDTSREHFRRLQRTRWGSTMTKSRVVECGWFMEEFRGRIEDSASTPRSHMRTGARLAATIGSFGVLDLEMVRVYGVCAASAINAQMSQLLGGLGGEGFTELG